jgi:hypothetical protein
MPPDESRSEGTPSLSEAPNAGAKPFAYFSAFGKVSRCKSGTASRNTRRNGYSPKTTQSLVGPKAANTQR